jgi:type II secretory pathway pseudopilin PulG
MMHITSSKGFSLAETVIALGVLATGVIGAAGVLAAGMTNLSSSPADVIMTQKASEAVESVFSARDSHKLTWAQIQNVYGANNDGGVFVDAATPLNTAGADGLVNTADDGTIETIDLPGQDGIIGTADDQMIPLVNYTRQITIRNVANENGNLRSIVVTITYQNGPTKRTYVLSTFISSYS